MTEPDSNHTLAERADDPRPIRADVYCVRCGYNLKTLDQTGICPECATPITASLSSRDEYEFVRRVRPAILWLMSGWLGYLLLILGWVIFEMAATTVNQDGVIVVFTFTHIVLAGIELYGTFLLTPTVTSQLLTERVRTLGRIMRFCVVAELIAACGWLFQIQMSFEVHYGLLAIHMILAMTCGVCLVFYLNSILNRWKQTMGIMVFVTALLFVFTGIAQLSAVALSFQATSLMFSRPTAAVTSLGSLMSIRDIFEVISRAMNIGLSVVVLFYLWQTRVRLPIIARVEKEPENTASMM